MFLSKNRLLLRTCTLLSFEGVDPRYPWYITQDITVAISRVIYHGYLLISWGLCHGYKRKPVQNNKRQHKVQHAWGTGGFMGWVIQIIFDPHTRQWGGGGFSRVVIRGSLLDHSWTILDHVAYCTFNCVPMVLWTCGSFFGSQFFGTSAFPLSVPFF